MAMCGRQIPRSGADQVVFFTGRKLNAKIQHTYTHMDILPGEIQDQIVVLAPVLRQTCQGFYSATRRLIFDIVHQHQVTSFGRPSSVYDYSVSFHCGGSSYLPDTYNPFNSPQRAVYMHSVLVRGSALDLWKTDVVDHLWFQAQFRISTAHAQKLSNQPRLERISATTQVDRVLVECMMVAPILLDIVDCITKTKYQFHVYKSQVEVLRNVVVVDGRMALPRVHMELAQLIRADTLYDYLCSRDYSPCNLGFAEVIKRARAAG
jgi:hypothetical protein